MSSGFKQFDGESAWRSEQFADAGWIDVLTPAQLQELGAAARALPEEESQWLAVTRDDLHLPTLGPHLAKVNKDLEEGKGFALLRGLEMAPADSGDYSQEDWAYRVNWVLAVALGNVIAQNTNGEVIGAVQAVVAANDNGMDTRGYVSSAELRFHCEGGDVASLLCVRQAPEGGLSSLASMHSIHNVMAHECPQHLAALYRGLPMYMRAEGDRASAEMPRQPLFFDRGDHLLAWVNLRLMELPYEAAGEAMPAAVRAALDALEEIAERSEYKLTFKLQPGDMLLVHNYVCMHNRTHFTDDPAPGQSRLMLRLWYNNAGGRVEAVQPPQQRAGYFHEAPYVIRHT